MVRGGVVPGRCLLQGGCGPRGWSKGVVSQHALRQTPPGEMATAADGAHPTECILVSNSFNSSNWMKISSF